MMRRPGLRLVRRLVLQLLQLLLLPATLTLLLMTPHRRLALSLLAPAMLVHLRAWAQVRAWVYPGGWWQVLGWQLPLASLPALRRLLSPGPVHACALRQA